MVSVRHDLKAQFNIFAAYVTIYGIFAAATEFLTLFGIQDNLGFNIEIIAIVVVLLDGLWKLKRSLGLRGNKDLVTSLLRQDLYFLSYTLGTAHV
ncbi:hypothetical protein Clacol_007808 [Clathrus columnatus]|uniref:Uncharacterized protein n=1 Tax=Clathrus columnatus TaxID=1419009 RepID=A0AAV5AKD3_9AGAM|nr:hypothetical protein Clacol_007808 [Clathrus columnatus]